MGLGVTVVVYGLVCMTVFVEAISVDSVLTKKLEEAIKGDELVISLKHIKPSSKSRGTTESLLTVDFPNSEIRLSLILDRPNKKVLIDASGNGQKFSRSFAVDTLDEDKKIKSLILAIHQNHPGANVTLYVDCFSYGAVETQKTMRDVFSGLSNPKILVSSNAQYHTEIDSDSNLGMVLKRNHCPAPRMDVHSERILDIFLDGINPLDNELGDDPYAESIATGRADIIPLPVELTDAELMKALKELISAVNYFKEKLLENTETIEYLRNLLEKCDICKQTPKPNCATQPPRCFPGTHCVDTPYGPKCGECPQGYVGDGITCTPGYRCKDRPCFDGVQCRDTSNGAECGPCPGGYAGDGFRCKPTCYLRPCFNGVRCEDTAEGAVCGRCPDGLVGDGITCTQTRSTCANKPCSAGLGCRDTDQGPVCHRCPAGYQGDGRQCRRSCDYYNPCPARK